MECTKSQHIAAESQLLRTVHPSRHCGGFGKRIIVIRVACRRWPLRLRFWLCLVAALILGPQPGIGQLVYHHSRPAITCGDLWFAALTTNGTVLVSAGAPPAYTASAWSNVMAIEAGYSHLVGLRANGTVVAGGANGSGQCSVGSWSNMVSIAAGYAGTLGLRANGTVAGVGWAANNGLAVGSWTGIVAIGMGHSHSVGVRADGTVIAVGDNGHGQCNLSGWSNVIAVACGDYHTLGLRADGTVMAAGDNSYNQCNVSGWSNVIQLDALSLTTVGLRADGVYLATGENAWNQTMINGRSGFVAVAAAENDDVGLRADGSVVYVGYPSLTGSLRTMEGWNTGVTQTNGYAMWTKRVRLPLHRRMPDQPNGPLRIPNLLAYASGLDPAQAQPADLPRLTAGSPESVRLIYRLSKTSVGVSLDVLASTGLPANYWDLVSGSRVRLVETQDGKAEWWAMDLSVAAGQGYFRLAASQQ